MTIHLTPSAQRELARLYAEASGKAGFILGVEAGGCAGLTYRLELADTPPPQAESLQIEGIPFYVHLAHAPLLDGLEIDYPTGLAARGFVFHNPQARHTCGCGTSFAI
ncbi:MAG: iron-sulfur cluster assembly accessory protein [Bacteroidia bacterium]|nr:iron-sulfur cluster assembly accessory protein [Bacteroidia bacterium]MDW8235466.1 iron-sulfur cluster assembly accessory protein [Bacteroidia bacterium]